MIVQPGGNGDCVCKSFDLKKRPPNTGVTVRFWPFGKWTMFAGAMTMAYDDGGVGRVAQDVVE